MSSVAERKERIERLKNYVNQISISDPSIKFDLISKIENNTLTTSTQIIEEIEVLEKNMKKEKKSRQEKRIKDAQLNNQKITFKNRNIKFKSSGKEITKKEPPKKQIRKETSKKQEIPENTFRIKEKHKNYVYEFETKTSGKFNYLMEKNLDENSEEDMKKANERRFRYPPVPDLNIYHACFSDIYFLYDYIPSPRRRDYKDQNILLSKEVEYINKNSSDLLDYKYNRNYVDYFTEILLKAIKGIYNNYFNDKIGIALIAIPPSKKNLSHQTKKSIDLIENWCEEGEYELEFKIYNFSNYLIRTKTVSSSKEGNRTLKKHKDSIECDRVKNVPSDIGFIILDDITTTGNTMYSCKDILIDNGYDNKDIICLALGRDVNTYSELISSDEGVILKENPNIERY